VVIVKGNFNYMEIKDFLFKVGISKNAQEYSSKKTYLHTNSLFDPRIRTDTNP